MMNVRLTFRITKAQKKALKALARANKISEAQVVRDLLAEKLKA